MDALLWEYDEYLKGSSALRSNSTRDVKSESVGSARRRKGDSSSGYRRSRRQSRGSDSKFNSPNILIQSVESIPEDGVRSKLDVGFGSIRPDDPLFHRSKISPSADLESFEPTRDKYSISHSHGHRESKSNSKKYRASNSLKYISDIADDDSFISSVSTHRQKKYVKDKGKSAKGSRISPTPVNGGDFSSPAPIPFTNTEEHLLTPSMPQTPIQSSATTESQSTPSAFAWWLW
jgi:hypothetical protein